MQTWVVVTMLTGLTSLAVAVIAWLQASRTAKLNARANLELERVKSENVLALEKLKAQIASEGERRKAETEMRLKAYDEASKDVTQDEATISQAWQTIQEVKEALSTVAGLPIAERFNTAAVYLGEPSKRLNTLFMKQGGSLPPAARIVLHHAKNLVFWYHSRQKLDEQEIQTHTLEAKRDELTATQTALLEVSERLRRDRMQAILRAWGNAGDAVPSSDAPVPKKD